MIVALLRQILYTRGQLPRLKAVIYRVAIMQDGCVFAPCLIIVTISVGLITEKMHSLLCSIIQSDLFSIGLVLE